MKAPSLALSLLLALSSTPAKSEAGTVAQSASSAKTAGSASQIQAAEAAFRRGYAAAQRHDLPAARLGFQAAVRLAPGVEAAHAALGSVLLELGELPEAIRELEAARRLDHSDQSNLFNLCVAYSDSHNFGQSIAAYRDVAGTSVTPPVLPPDVAIAVATALSATGDPAQATTILERTLEAESADSPSAATPESAHLNARLNDTLGTLLAQQHQFAGAETHFRRAITLDAALAAAHFHLGSVALATGRPADAIAELERAHTLEPAAVAYALELARAFSVTGRETAAITLLRGALSSAATDPASPQATEIRYRLALALQAADDPKSALPLFIEVVSARPTDASALTNAGLAHVQLGDAKAGIELYLRALKLTPSDPTLREDLGVAYLQQADLDDALIQFRAGLAIDPESPQLHYDLGLALKLKDDLAAAVPEFERAATLDPDLPDPPYTLGIIYMQQGNFEKAAASLETATTLRPSNGDAWATLGSVYQQMQQPEKAIPALRHAIELLPQQPSPHITLAAILAAQGHKDEAAAERKIGAALSRAAVNRQKANFGLDSGNLLMKRGQLADALVQFQSAVDADPNYAAPHLALANALERSGRKAEAAEERRKAAALQPNP
jgi:tetratricopeptide (TPR) repeat protein